jgi:hypothetical protein
MLDRVYGSPARSYCGDHSSATESEGEETLELLTEIPSSPDQTILDGWLKFRDNKKVSKLDIIDKESCVNLGDGAQRCTCPPNNIGAKI